MFKNNTYRISFAFFLILGASLAAQAQVRPTISVQELYNEYNAKPVAGTISVQQLLAESTPVAGTVSVRELQAEQNATGLPVNISTTLPRMSPELALDAYFRRTQRQTRQPTYRARADRNMQRLARERLQTRHDRARVRLYEERLAAASPREWLGWRARQLAGLLAAIPRAIASAFKTLRAQVRRARRFAVDRWRARRSPKPE